MATPEADYGNGTPAPECPEKEDYLDIPLDQLSKLKKRVSGRSIYIGDREAFFKYLSTVAGS